MEVNLTKKKPLFLEQKVNNFGAKKKRVFFVQKMPFLVGKNCKKKLVFFIFLYFQKKMVFWSIFGHFWPFLAIFSHFLPFLPKNSQKKPMLLGYISVFLG